MPQHYSNVLVESCRGRCAAMLHVQAWGQYHDSKGRAAEELKSYASASPRLSGRLATHQGVRRYCTKFLFGV